MANDRQVIQFLSPAELVGLMNAAGVVTVHETGTSDGKPVIHASVKVVNAETGEQLPGGLPFSVVMFKGPGETGYSNIAIGTIVPVSELKIALPRNYFNFCNQRFRFTRVFPVDEQSFVIQMDMVLKNATREYVKFGFGLWGALFSQILFELMGRGREALVGAAEALAHTDFAQQVAVTPELAITEPLPEATSAEPEELTSAATPDESEAVLPLVAEAIIPVETLGGFAEPVQVAEASAVAVEALVESAMAGEPVTEKPAAEIAAAEMVDKSSLAETATGSDDVVEETTDCEPELSIAAGPTPGTDVFAQVNGLAEEKTVAELGEAKDVVPA
jgi:hypothetical protein